jgi:glutamate synthase (NADPH/NADH) large chain
MTASNVSSSRQKSMQGLYRPEFEHDACGVGMICDLKNRKSHTLIEDALQILVNLTHRGACGCDETTGDGAGIILQKPHDFLARAALETAVKLPAEEDYAAGLVFLPSAKDNREAAKASLVSAVERKGLDFLGWRHVPVVAEAAGDLARRVMPVIQMAFVGKGDPEAGGAEFERRLFLARKVAEHQTRRLSGMDNQIFHIASLSPRTLVYKGMLLADQMSTFFPDLCDPLMASALALVHQRYSTNTFPSWDLAQPFRYLCHNGEINTVRGNTNWMRAREPLFESPLFGEAMADLLPVTTPEPVIRRPWTTPWNCCCTPAAPGPVHDDADSRSLAAPRDNEPAKKDFYAYHACLMEPWDGPAAIAFTDGSSIGAVLDRNGLRPSRYTVTRDDRVIMASETGVLPVDPSNVAVKASGARPHVPGGPGTGPHHP